MIRVVLQNGNILLFHEYERITTVGWISDDGEYWSNEDHFRADELEREHNKGVDLYIIERINELGEAIFDKDWLSPIASVRKFIPTPFVSGS